MHYYRIGADTWDTFADVPAAEETKDYYLKGESLAEEPSEDSSRSYDYDPDDPVISRGADTLFETMKDLGSIEIPKPGKRGDVLTYVSDPLKEDLDLTGKISADLWITSSAPDTCFVIRVREMLPDGRSYHIRTGITTLAWRNGTDKKLSYSGGPLRITLTCWDISWRMKKGSRIRLDITSSDFPEYSVHPNTEKNWAEETDPVTAHQTILEGRQFPSVLHLPLA